jgi:glycosyltransferase involved in cell wall biosynthesis
MMKWRKFMGLAFWFSLFVFVLMALLSLEVVCGVRKIAHLKDMPSELSGPAPRVSIIFSALNEADTIEPALQSLLALDYPNLEIIAINDRSTDATPAILDRLAARHPVLRVLHLDALAPGWLGKNHALHQGAHLASGEFLIFTDADVRFDPSAVKRAVACCQRDALDHLTLFFQHVASTSMLRMMTVSTTVGLFTRYKPWKVTHSVKHYMGVGAFNMVRTSAYQRAGGHAAIPFVVLDDIMLGKLMKASGARQRVLFGSQMVAVEWYRDSAAMARGLQKNIYALFDFRLAVLLAVTVVTLLLRVWPWIGLFAFDGPTRWLNGASLLCGLAMYADLIRHHGWNYRDLALAPLLVLVELAIWWVGSINTLRRGGIDWRGTRYSLAELKRGQY